MNYLTNFHLIVMANDCHEDMTGKRGEECHKVNDIRLIFSLVMFIRKTLHCSIPVMSFDAVITNVKHSLESYIRGSTEFFDTQHS